MPRDLPAALAAGYERLSAWTDLLDRINVFPVADADTGRNLKISLAPLREAGKNLGALVDRLLLSATGNSGNIAACFFSGFLVRDPMENLRGAARDGKERAWEAVVDPRPGTMLTLFDALLSHFESEADPAETALPALVAQMEIAVHSTTDLLPTLKAAGVVDAGALGMFICLEGFFRQVAGWTDPPRPVTEIFAGKLRIDPAFTAPVEEGYCIDTVVRAGRESAAAVRRLSEFGESVVVIPEQEMLKIHLHTGDREALRRYLESFGPVVRWSEEAMAPMGPRPEGFTDDRAVHIVTDGAGSITRTVARELGITLLDSYVVIGDRSLPETLLNPETLYAAMAGGIRVSTAQASVFERHERYRSLLSQYGQVLYLCVGSVFTGNYDLVAAWKRENDPDDRLAVIDTGAASGRLGLIALATARRAARNGDGEAIARFARMAMDRCREYIFLDRLKYLVAGGRLSKSKGFFGDMLGVKPVISPTAEGAIRAGTVRSRDEQIRFALERLAALSEKTESLLILLQYSDNRIWVEATVMPAVSGAVPRAEILVQPLSATSGAHMGPGTWSIAMLPGWGETPSER